MIKVMDLYDEILKCTGIILKHHYVCMENKLFDIIVLDLVFNC